MLRIFGICIGVLLLIAIGYPFAQDAYHRYLVSQQLDRVMDSHDRAAFRQWSGDAASFAKTLYDRCEITYGRGAAQCQRYKSVFQ